MEILMAGQKDERRMRFENFVAGQIERLWLDAGLDAILRPTHKLREHVVERGWVAVPVALGVLAEVTCEHTLGDSTSRLRASTNVTRIYKPGPDELQHI